LSESDVCYIIICFAESLLLLLEAGRRLSPERLIEMREDGRSVSMSAFDDDLIAERIKIAAACLHQRNNNYDEEQTYFSRDESWSWSGMEQHQRQHCRISDGR